MCDASNSSQGGILQTTSVTAADKLFNDDKYEEAKTAYKVALKTSPKSFAARIGLLRSLYRLDDWKAGITEAKAAEAALPQNPDFKGFESIFLMRAAQPDDAVKAAEAAIKAGKDNYWALLAEGRSQAWQYHYDAARKLMRHAIELQPATEEGYIVLISTFSETESADEHKVVEELRLIVEKRHPRKPPKDIEEADKRKALDARSRDAREKLAAYYQMFAKEPGFKGLSPLTDAAIRASDQGEEPPVSFTFPIDRGEGEAGKDDIIIPVMLDGVKLKMLFDTGAGHAFALGKYPASRLNLPVLAKSEVAGVNGVEVSKMHRAERLTIGKQVFGNIPVESIDNSIGEEEDGLIGGAVFDKYVVTVDCKENTMTLTRGQGAVAPKPLKGDKVVEVPFHDMNGYIYVQISVDNHKWWTILDTGAQRYGVLSLDLAKMLAKERDKTSSIELTVKGRVGIGISETSYNVLVFEFPIDVGCLVGDRTPYFIEMDELYGASIVDKLSADMDFNVAGLLGVSYLGQRCRRFSIDYPNHIITMEQPDE